MKFRQSKDSNSALTDDTQILKDDFRRLQSRYKNYQQVNTDGSKEDSKVGCAVISGNHSNMQRIPDNSSIFTAEANAVDLAIKFYNVLKAMNHTSSKNPQIQKLLEKCHELLAKKKLFSVGFLVI